MLDLAPDIPRQRLVIEGIPSKPIAAQDIVEYLLELSQVLNMTALMNPVTHLSSRFGWAGWIHWETSGAHFYAWDEPMSFFSVDIYTCKPFDDAVAVDFTRRRFEAPEIVHHSF